MQDAPRVMARQKKILVADDDQFLAELICATLSGQGYQTVVAHDGVQAMRVFEQHKVDCVLLDLVMPGLDGFGVLAQKALSTSTAKIPVVVLSSRNRMIDVEKAMALGATAYVIKPFKPEALMTRLRRAVPSVFTAPPVSLAPSEPRQPVSAQPPPKAIEWMD